mmetsp:Transcript_237/g.739  ORF Transcript_237/g.739 Transcript_237/m.739 type:complete len:435 (-) Transcript_237:344-1648(-)
MGASALCRCNCGKELDLGPDFDGLYEVDLRPVKAPRAVETKSYSIAADQELRGGVVRRGELWHFTDEGPAQLVELALHANGFRISHDNGDESVALSPFTLLSSCTPREASPIQGGLELKMFKLSLFTQTRSFYFGLRGNTETEAQEERERWLADIANVMQLMTQSLFPHFRISCEPLDTVSATLRRLMAGYLLRLDTVDTATVVYCELHPHSDISGQAKLAMYDNELCHHLVKEIRLAVGTVLCEKVGVDCTCFCVDGHTFSARIASERKVWLRAISNLKVKLHNGAPTPSGDDLRHYRSAIEEHVASIHVGFGAPGTAEPLLEGLPRRRRPSAPPPMCSLGEAEGYVAEPAALSAVLRRHPPIDGAAQPKVPDDPSVMVPRSLPHAVCVGPTSGGAGGNQLETVSTDVSAEGAASGAREGCTHTSASQTESTA